jgi:serine/threonine-protein kinase
LRRFQKEAHAAANLSHPNIVTVHDIGQDGRRYYIVMEYVEGSTLKELIRTYRQENDRPLHLDRTLDITIQVCAGVGYAHRANLVHCDVKSQNVLVTRDGRVKVTDFGIARAISETSLHKDDLMWGTPQYFSPEQAAGEPATPASDVYSIGVIMFEMLTSLLPFEADTHTALALKHIHEKPPLVTEYNPYIPDQIDRIVTKVLSKEPSGRYRTADQLGRVLISYRNSSVEDTGSVPVGTGQEPVPIAEQKTIMYPHENQVAQAALISGSQQSGNLSADGRDLKRPDVYLPVPEEEQETDWIAIGLGFLALISLLGLIPLWYLVFIQFTS